MLAYCQAAALLHRCFPYNLSTTMQGAIVKLRGASPELCTLFIKTICSPRSANCPGVCWEEGMGSGGVFVFREVGTMKSLHWRCEMWFD